MNKLFTKVAALSVGLAMAIGVGVALGSQKAAVRVKADGTAISASELVSGDKCFIVAGGKVLKAGATFAAKNSGNRTATFDASSLTEDEAWLFTKSGDNWTITTEVSSETQYLYCTNDNNGLVCGTTEASATTLWTITATASEATTSYLKGTDGTNDRYLALYASTPNFRIYKNTGSGDPVIQLYKYSAPSKTVTSLTVVSNPTKTSYDEGDALDLTGVSVKATWSDSTESDVTSEAVYSPANGTILSPSVTEVTVTYGGKSASISITVSEKLFATDDMYITAEGLELATSYSSADAFFDYHGDSFAFGRTDVMKGINATAGTIQLKASTGKFYNKSKYSAPISKVYFLADADNNNAPSNWAVYGSADTAGSTTTKLTVTTVDSTNRIYSVDFSASSYYYFTVAKTGSYATYFDMIVVELAHSGDDVAAVRSAAADMLTVFGQFCSAGKGPSDSQWSTIAGYYTALTSAQKEIFNAVLLNAMPCNASDAYGAPVQGTDLQKAVQKIEYCVSTYGVDNFTDRPIDVSSLAKLTNSFNNQNNTTMIIIVAIAAVSAISLAAVLVIKKRKHN